MSSNIYFKTLIPPTFAIVIITLDLVFSSITDNSSISWILLHIFRLISTVVTILVYRKCYPDVSFFSMHLRDPVFWLKFIIIYSVIFITPLLINFMSGEKNLSFQLNLYYLFTGCLVIPVLEEFIYRYALCIPFQKLLGTWKTVIISGTLFAILHYIYGNPSLYSFVTGFIFAFAFLYSKSIFIPIILHSLSNFYLMLFW